MDHNKLWKIPKEMGIPDHLIFHLISLYAGQEATVRTGLDPWVGKILWRRELLLTPVFSSGEFHGLFHGVAKTWT